MHGSSGQADVPEVEKQTLCVGMQFVPMPFESPSMHRTCSWWKTTRVKGIAFGSQGLSAWCLFTHVLSTLVTKDWDGNCIMVHVLFVQWCI